MLYGFEGVKTQGWICKRGVAYAVFTNADTIIQLAHHPFQFLLQSQATGLLLGGCHRQSEDPSLEDCPHRGTSPAGLNGCEVGIVLLDSVRWCRASAGVWEYCMPLCELACYASEDGRSDQVFMATGLAANEAIEEAVLEAGEKRRSQATAGKEGMGSRFS
jgi:hypothetical protein